MKKILKQKIKEYEDKQPKTKDECLQDAELFKTAAKKTKAGATAFGLATLAGVVGLFTFGVCEIVGAEKVKDKIEVCVENSGYEEFNKNYEHEQFQNLLSQASAENWTMAQFEDKKSELSGIDFETYLKNYATAETVQEYEILNKEKDLNKNIALICACGGNLLNAAGYTIYQVLDKRTGKYCRQEGKCRDKATKLEEYENKRGTQLSLV